MWRLGDDDVVYKIESFSTGAANEIEHEHMLKWRGFDWAPPTFLYPVAAPAVLAMPFYPCPIESVDEIPPNVHEVVRGADVNLFNFRKTADGQVMLIDAGDP